MQLRILTGHETRELLTYPDCIRVIRDAMVEVSRRNVTMPLRHAMPIPNGRGMLGFMYGAIGNPDCFGTKIISLYPDNPAHGLSSHLGLVTLYESGHGRPLAIMDGSVVTAIRTAAASAVATDALARTDSDTLAIVGTGEQAATHLRAMCEVRHIKTARVWGRNPDKVAAFIEEHGDAVPARLCAAVNAEAAVTDVDIICTVTAAAEPVVSGDWIAPGTHLNLVGSSFPTRAEVDTALVAKSRFYIDYLESALAEAGEFLRAKEAGAVNDSHIVAEIGQVISGDKPGRGNDEEITVYKSLGVIAQDLAAAMFIYEAARQRDIGTVIDM